MRFVFSALPYGRVVGRAAPRRSTVRKILRHVRASEVWQVNRKRLGRISSGRWPVNGRRWGSGGGGKVASPKNGHAGAKRRLPRKARSRHAAESRTRETESVGGFMGARVKA